MKLSIKNPNGSQGWGGVGKVVMHKEIPFGLSMNLSAESLQARREWNNIFKVLKEKNASQKSSIWQSYSLDMKKK